MDEPLTDTKPKPGDRPDEPERASTEEEVEGFARRSLGPAIDPALLELPLTMPPIRFDPEPWPWRRLDPQPDPWKEAGGTGKGPIGL